jgi:hypothetical protein
VATDRKSQTNGGSKSNLEVFFLVEDFGTFRADSEEKGRRKLFCPAKSPQGSGRTLVVHLESKAKSLDE